MKSFGFRPELNFTQKGLKLDFFDGEAYWKGEETYNYIEMPLNFTYGIKAGNGKVILGAGPYLGVGISGKSKSTVTSGGVTESLDVSVKFDGKKAEDVTDGDTHLKAFDAGLSFLGGYQLKNGLAITMGYEVGLANISPDSEVKMKNRSFTFKIGYLFNRK